MATVTIEGRTIGYDEAGSGPAIILGHGFLMDRSMFAPQVAALSDRYRVITYDARGFGETPADGPFSYWDIADDCLGLLDHLEIDRAIVGGMSQGGFVGLRVALKRPERVRGLVLIDSADDVDEPMVIAGYRAMLATWLSQGAIDPLVEAVAGLILGDRAHWEPWVSRWRARPADALRYPADCLLDRDDLRPRTPEITAPTLLVHGTADTSIALERAEATASRLPQAELVRIDGAPHAANLTHPDAVNRAIRAFLDGLP